MPWEEEGLDLSDYFDRLYVVHLSQFLKIVTMKNFIRGAFPPLMHSYSFVHYLCVAPQGTDRSKDMLCNACKKIAAANSEIFLNLQVNNFS